MRLRNVPGARDVIADSPLVVHDPEKAKGSWNKIFNNNHPLRIEIGMGKGQFLTELARQNPEINYVGIEKYSSVLIRAIEKRSQEDLPNLLFVRMDAEHIHEVFGEEEVEVSEEDKIPEIGDIENISDENIDILRELERKKGKQ